MALRPCTALEPMKKKSPHDGNFLPQQKVMTMFLILFAGKTESTKIMVQHIVTLCKAEHEGLHDKIVQVQVEIISRHELLIATSR